jgi:hypothetical protein
MTIARRRLRSPLPSAKFVAAVLAATAAGCFSPAERPGCSPPTTPGEIGSLCGFRNPEDLEHVRRAGLVVVSNLRFGGVLGEDGGFMAAFEPGLDAVAFRLWPREGDPPAAPDPALGDPSCTVPPEPDAFYPHGLTSRTELDHVYLYIVGHAGSAGSREAIEIFEMTGRGPDARLVWKACIPTPGNIAANDVVTSADGERIVASNFQPDHSMRHTITSALLGSATGNVITWTHADGWKPVEGSDARMANGVALARRGETVLYAETMSGSVHRLPLGDGGGAIEISIGGNPDNFTETPRGTLLLATHTAGAAFMLCQLGRLPCKTSWAVYEIDPETLATQKVIEHDGSRVGAVATALEVDGILYLGTVFDDRVGIVSSAPASASAIEDGD